MNLDTVDGWHGGLIYCIFYVFIVLLSVNVLIRPGHSYLGN